MKISIKDTQEEIVDELVGDVFDKAREISKGWYDYYLVFDDYSALYHSAMVIQDNLTSKDKIMKWCAYQIGLRNSLHLCMADCSMADCMCKFPYYSNVKKIVFLVSDCFFSASYRDFFSLSLHCFSDLSIYHYRNKYNPQRHKNISLSLDYNAFMNERDTLTWAYIKDLVEDIKKVCDCDGFVKMKRSSSCDSYCDRCNNNGCDEDLWAGTCAKIANTMLVSKTCPYYTELFLQSIKQSKQQ